MTVFFAITATVVVLWLVRLFVNYYLKIRVIEKSLIAAAEDIGLLATTPEEIFEHNLKVLQGTDPEQAARYIHTMVMRTIIDGKPPRKVDVERLKKLERLKAIDEDGLTLYPDAVYEMSDVVRGRVFFRRDLTLAGYKDYRPDVEEILVRTMEQKYLLPDDAKFLQRIHCVFEITKWGERYGGPGFPYPEMRYHVSEEVHGEQLDLYFDNNLCLIVVVKRQNSQRDDVLWELPGARQPELYH